MRAVLARTVTGALRAAAEALDGHPEGAAPTTLQVRREGLVLVHRRQGEIMDRELVVQWGEFLAEPQLVIELAEMSASFERARQISAQGRTFTALAAASEYLSLGTKGRVQ